jgi:hypothetical protein
MSVLNYREATSSRREGTGIRGYGKTKPPLPNPLFHKCVEERELGQRGAKNKMRTVQEIQTD